MRRSAGLATLLLAGCTVGPNYRTPELPVPTRYAESATQASPSDVDLAAWWTRFGDPTLDRLIGRALAQNLDVEAAAARIREARAAETVAGATALPQVDAQASANRQRISENAIPVPPGAGGGTGGTGGFGLPGSEFNTFRVGFDASWEIDLFGKTRRSLEAARARTGAAIWDQRDLQVSAAAEVADAYFGLREAQERIATAEAELALETRFQELVLARARGGLITGQDLEQKQSERSTAAAAIPPLRSEAEARIHALGILTGDNPETLSAELGKPELLPASVQPIPPGIPSELLRRRPDIRSAERRLAASTADIGVAVADLYPRFSLTAAPALVSTALASLLEWGSRSFSVGAALDWPIFNGHRSRANIEVANARQSEALIDYRKSVLTALQDVEDALSRTRADRSQLTDLEAALTTAARAEGIAQTRYDGGLVIYSEVLLARAQRLKLEDQVTQAKGALARDNVALFKALGGGWAENSTLGAIQ
jgi:NodT family efflux transporter outer membrane factor (OMF) lipoprotein